MGGVGDFFKNNLGKIAGTVAGALLAPVTGGLSVPAMAAIGGGLGGGIQSAATGGNVGDILLNTGTGAALGYGGGSLASGLGYGAGAAGGAAASGGSAAAPAGFGIGPEADVLSAGGLTGTTSGISGGAGAVGPGAMSVANVPSGVNLGYGTVSPAGVVDTVTGRMINSTVDQMLSGGSSKAPTSTGVVDKVTGFAKNNPTLTAAGLYTGANLLGSSQQAGMMQGLNTANQEAYNNYLSTINPPADVLNARYNAARQDIRTGATQARRRISDTMAARGIRGQGTASPAASYETNVVQPAMNKAYNDVYGQYNVPSAPGPANWAPTTGQLAGTNLANTASYLLPLVTAKQLGLIK